MRIGFNPHKDLIQEQSAYLHQIVIPVYIPHQEGYFKDSFKILDRIDQSYSIIPMAELISKNRIPLDFTSIYQILSSGCFLDPDIFYEFKKDLKQCTLYGISEFKTLSYQLDTFRLLPLFIRSNL